MNTNSFIFQTNVQGQYRTEWQAPSNIALVKYWGKYGEQLPENPSISFTLSQCFTNTEVSFSEREPGGVAFDFLFDQKKQPEFYPKIQKFMERITPYFPALKRHHLSISSHNSFPHSSGIASSASAMAALALCIVDFEKQFNSDLTEEAFLQKASFLARLGSGSAARSIAGPLTIWGYTKAFSQSNDHYAIAPYLEWDPIFLDYQDTILIVDKGQKKVSSTLGHALMQDHPFATQRFEQAHKNLGEFKRVLIAGDLERFIHLVESEALCLHAMMMTSYPHFVLMQPNTLSIIKKVEDFRFQTQLPICFTLDAGANVHLLYPLQDRIPIIDFILEELVIHCQNGQYIEDQVGNGAKKILV